MSAKSVHLFVSDDIFQATNKLADYYLREFTEISLYSASEEEEKVSLPKLYVPMIWKRYNQGWYTEEDDDVEDEYDEDYVGEDDDDHEYEDDKGKFMKSFSQIWMKVIINKWKQ